MAPNHGLTYDLDDDLELFRERIRPTTMAAEGPLHELGAIQIINSDSQGMGRIGETLRRTIQLAHVMKAWAHDQSGDDNERFLRYLAKCTIEPAITHGISEHVGTLRPGRVADMVFWKPAWLGVKPEVVLKAGYPVWGAYGDGNSTVSWAEPRRYARGWGGRGGTPASVSLTFVSGSLDGAAFGRHLNSHRAFVPVQGTRGLTRSNLWLNRGTAAIEIDPRDGHVALDGRPLTVQPVTELPLNRAYFVR